MQRRNPALLASVAIAALAACGSSAARTTHAPAKPTAHCAPAGAKVMAADHRVQVYALSGSVYACDVANSKPTRLGSATICIARACVRKAAVAGELVAYGAEMGGVDTGSAAVNVLRLSDGKQLHSFAAITGAIGPEAYQSVDSLVVKRDGSVAWISTVNSIIGRGSDTEVHANGHRLDSGSGIAPNSLRLSGSTLTWRHGTTTHSATLG